MRSWVAADLEADRSWHLRCSDAELNQLVEWVASVDPDSLAADPSIIDRLVLDAPRQLVERAEQVRFELVHGPGLSLLSGLDLGQPGFADERRVAIAFLLFGRLIGSLRSQNAAGHLLGHVTDVGADIEDPRTRIYQTNHRQTFHTDSTDAVGLLCLRPAKSGGASMVVNVEAVYDRMQAESPALVERLFEPVATDRRGEQPEGELPWFEIPVLNRTGDRITGIYQRQYIDSAARFDAAPRLDSEHVEALDRFDAIMNDPAVHFQMSFEPGDMQFVHNHSLLHDRTGFIDHDEPERRRHLLRVWLSLPGDRELPDSFKQRYGSITVGDRGGITVPGTRPTISFEP
jgi:hypothetical protein